MLSIVQKTMKKIITFINKISGVLGYLSGVVLIFAAIITTYDVITRFMFGLNSIWTLEVSQYSLLFATFMGAAYALKEKAYISVDFIVEKCFQKHKKYLDCINGVLIVILFAGLSYLSWKLTYQYYIKGWTSSTPLRVKLYILYSMIFIGTAFVVLQQIAELLASLTKKDNLL